MEFANILLWLHIVGFVAGGATAVTMPLLERQLAQAAVDRRGELFALGNKMIQLGKVAMGLLLISGPLMWWLKWGLVVPNHWFFAKMGLIVVMLVCIVMSGLAFKKMQAGDMSVAGRSAVLGLITLVAGAGVLLTAVLAFN
ncbi:MULTISPECIES: hypothetical protein [Devosia]|uniref:Uncharacterized protein n=1 Tax=Devosia equisanguinis TaxID=2490941 RepID=A0A3S5D3K4_9HYPH|nr:MULTISPECIES: hypothetical protein [Devosia]ODT49946.1 MAG: hypothetical protein ABS74_05495 [Pelagibacterium sp. SCN 63-126]ODU85284.1 MAG: hypothetical protein ABT14_13650 [Pelagibacterium sp. SCN 63-17]OJX45371.1 MAG: hypothetical protein BGO80_06020 [Devosia sp. 63-57]VDS05831.1 hypothetical protein DEVEQU_02976 [Devosia equisanguinis]